MILCLDVGNSQIFGGVYGEDEVKFQFRKTSLTGNSSDEIGIFLRNVLRENNIEPEKMEKIAICSVVPDQIYSLKNAAIKYFGGAPFILGPGVRTGLQILYRNPLEVGADRIANAISATAKYPGRDIIIIDMGTATTFCVVSCEKKYFGGAILPGLRISMNALESNTAKLPNVEIVKPTQACGRSTIESIQSGLYYSHVGTMKEMISRITKESFKGQRPVVIATGGFAHLFQTEGIFDEIVNDLVLQGIYQAYKMNI